MSYKTLFFSHYGWAGEVQGKNTSLTLLDESTTLVPKMCCFKSIMALCFLISNNREWELHVLDSYHSRK